MFDLDKFLSGRPIKLVKGKGKPETGGCWMSALSAFVGAGKWTDELDCVCPTINRLCIEINDVLSDTRRGEILLPRLLDPLGTVADDIEVIKKRMFIIVDAAVRTWVAQAMKSIGLIEHYEKISSLPEIVDRGASQQACAAITAAAYADAAYAVYAADAAYAVDAAIRAARFAATDDAAAADAAAKATSVAVAVVRYAADATKDQFVVDYVLPVLDRMIAVGNNTPIEMNCGVRDFEKALQVA